LLLWRDFLLLVTADHAGGRIGLDVVCGGKDESIVGDGHTGFLGY
jgi:hypothetical protein